MRASLAASVCAAFVFAACSTPEPVPVPEPMPDRMASTVVAEPATGLLADGQAKSEVTVTVVDVDGKPLADVQVALSATGEGVTVSQPPTPTDASGVTKGSLTSTRPGTVNVSATATLKGDSFQLSKQAQVEFVPGPAAKLVFAVPPSSAKAGAVMAPAIQVAVQDSFGNVIFDSTAAVTLGLAANDAGGTLSGTTTVAATSGVAVFSDLSIEKAGAGYTLVATAEGLAPATSDGFEISVSSPARLAFVVGPSTAGAGAIIAPPVQVAIQDAQGNLISTATDVVSLALGTNPSQGTLSGTPAVRAVGGVATFSDLSIDKAGIGFSLAATARNLAGATSEPFNVTSAEPTRLVFTVQPSAAVAGAAIAPAVQVSVQDDFGNVIPSSTPQITLALATNAADAVLGGTVTATAVDGVATFDALVVERAGSGYSLVATAEGLAQGISAPFSVGPAAASRLAFEVQPRNTAAGSAIAPSVEVAVHDDYGNRVITARNQISVALGNNPGGTELQGTTSSIASSGLARFFDLRMEKSGSGYTLVASAAGLSGATSTGFDITNAAPTLLAFVTEPGTTVAGEAIAPAVEVELLDRFGNRAVDSTELVDIDLGANEVSGVMLGTAQVAAVDGVAHFADLSIDKAAAGYTLVASWGTRSVASAPFEIVPAAPAKLAWQQQPTTVAAATAITPAPSIKVLDAFGNFVSDATNAVTVALQGGTSGAVLSGSTNVSAVSGVATFAALKIDKSGAGYSLRASSSGLVSVLSSNFDVSIGAPATVAFKVQPRLSTVNTTLSPAIDVEVRDAGGNLVAAATPVTLALGNNPTSAILNGSTTVNTASGVASFNDLSVSKAGLGYTLAASVAGTPGATSSAFDVQVGGPTKLAFSVQPTNTVAGVAINPSLQVSVLDQWGNVVPSASAEVTIAADPGSPGLASGTLSAFPVNGIVTFSNVILEKVGTYKLIASSAGLTDGESVNFVVSVAPPSASTSSVEVNPAAGVVADGLAGSTIKVTVRDAFGNPISGAAVALTASGSANTLTTPAVTNALGVTTSTIKSTKAEIKTITATVGGTVLLDATPTITFVPGAPSATLSTAVASPATGVTADGVALSYVTVTVLDAKGNPVPGAAVAVTSSGTGHTISPSPAPLTDLDGVSVVAISSTKAETKTLTTVVTVGTTNTTLTSAKPTVVFVPGPPSSSRSSVTVGAASMVAGTAAQIVTVVVRDATDNLIPGVTVVLEASPVDGNTLTQPTAVTTATGVATGKFTSTKAEVKTITAVAGGVILDASPTVTVVPAAVSTTASKAVASPATGVTADGIETSTITVTARDAFSNPVPNAKVALSALPITGNSILPSPAPNTDASGTSIATIASTKAEKKVITATVTVGTANAVLADKPAVTFVPGAPNAARSSVTVSAASNVVANDVATSTITVTVKDAYDNLVQGAVVALASSGTGDTISTPLPTGVDGKTTATIKSTKAETKTITATVNGTVVLDAAPTITFVPGPFDVGTSMVAAAPAIVSADNIAVATITVILLDAFYNPVPAKTVTLTVTPTTTENTVSTPAATDASGKTTATLKSTKADVKTISAKVGTVFITQTASVEFKNLSVNETKSTVAISPTGTPVADGVETRTITATLRDVNGNVVPGVEAFFSSSGTANTITPASGFSDAFGVVTATIASTKAEVKEISVVAEGLTIAQHPTVTFVAGAPSASTSSVSATSPVVADGTAASTVTVTLRDAFGNTVPGFKPVLSASGSSNTFVQPSANTGADGVAIGSVKSTKAEVKTITAAVGTLTLAMTPSVTFVAGAPSATESKVAVSPAAGVTADGGAVSYVTVTVLDAKKNPVPGAAVAVSSSGTGDTISAAPATDAAGVSVATIASTKAEVKTLTAVVTVGGVNTTIGTKPTVTFIAGPPDAARSSVAVSASSLIAGATTGSTVTVTVRDQFDNLVPGVAVSLQATPVDGNTLTQPTAVTTAAGVATGNLKSTKAEVKMIAATAGGVLLDPRPTVTILPAAVSAGVSTVVASPAAGVTADGVATSTVTVTALDQYSNPVPGVNIALAATPTTGNTISSPPATDANGVSTATIASTKAETKTITATATVGTTNTVLTAKPTVAFVYGAASASVSTVTVSPESGVVANDTATATITVIVKDAQGNPVQGANVSLLASGSGNTVSAPAATDATGKTTATIKSTKAESKTITATVNGATVLDAVPTVTFVPGPVSPSVSTLEAAPAVASADGISTATITVTALDANSNPVPGQTVTLTVSGTLNDLSAPAATGVNGESIATLASTKAEAKTISAKVGTVSLNQVASVEFKNLSVNETNSTVVVSPAGNPVADNVQTRTITATLRDVNGNPVPDKEAFFYATGSDNTITPVSGTSDAAGVVTATIASTKAEVKTISVVAEGLTIAQQPTIIFVAGVPNAVNSSVVATSPVVADNTSSSTITVTVRDAFGNLVSGAKPVLTASGSVNTFVQPGTTNADGVAIGTLKSSKAELKTVTATVGTAPALVIDQKPEVNFIPGQVSATASSFTVNPALGVVADGVNASAITVTLKDAAGNVIPNMPVSFSSTGLANTFTAATTDATGVAVSYLRSTVAETKTVSVIANGVTLSTTKTVGFIAGPPSMAESTFTVSPAFVTADGVGTAALVITARDAHRNLVPSAAVSLRSTGSFNKFTPASGLTTVAGVFSSLLSSTMAEPKQLLAAVGGATGFTLIAQATFGYTLPQIKALTVASGGGCVAVNYSVQQAQAKRVDVLVEYSATSSGAFAPATQAGSTTADGIDQVTTLAAVGGQAHTFLWNTTADLPRRVVTDGRVRVTPYINGQAGVSMIATIGALSNGLTFGTTAAMPAGGHPVAVAQADFNRDGKLDLVTANAGDDAINVLLGTGSGAFSAAKPFAARQPLSSLPPFGLSALVTGDFDGDGDQDIAAAGSYVDQVVIFLNDGTGNFPLPKKSGGQTEDPPRPSYQVGAGPVSIAAADFDRDGWVDLATAGSGGASVLLNAVSPTVSFLLTGTLSAGLAPSSIAAADVDRNGWLDLLVTNKDSSDVSVLLAAGAGAFGAATNFPVGAEPSAVTSGDFDSDGDLDLAVAGAADNTLSVLLGTGTGSFAAGAVLVSGIGPASLAADDFDGDGNLDLVVANEIENTLGVHLGNGDGTFADSAKPVASGQPMSLVVGDYNRDGKPDLAAAAWFGNVVDVLLNTRPRRCDPGLEVATNAQLGTSPQALSGGDFNGDGKADVAIIDGIDGDLKVLLGTGNGGYRPPVVTAIPGGGGSHFVAADFDADGKLDVATPALTGANLFKGAGTGAFAAPVATAGGTFPTSLAAGDFNGDDKLDVVTMMETNGLVSVFLFSGSAFATPVHLAVGGQPQSAVAGDFDRDGWRDLAVVNLAKVAVARGNGDGTFSALAYYDAGAAPAFVVASDFDDDGELDLAVANRDGASVSILRGNGDASFAAASSYPVAASPRWLSVDDLDASGSADLLVGFANGSGQAAMVLLGNGDGTLRAATSWRFSATPVAVTSADFDADGKKDLAAAVASASPRLTTLFGKGDGTFPSIATHAVDAQPHVMTATDFDRDGAMDLAVSALLDGRVDLLLGSGDGTFMTASPVTVASPGASLHADLNRDGKPDLLVVSSVTGQLSVLLGNADGTFGAATNYVFPGSSPAPSALASGDFDRDGAPDVVVANGAANLVCFFWGDGTGALTPPALPCKVVGDGPTSIALGDFNKDGIVDVATANGPHNSVGVLLSVGDRSFLPLLSFPVGDPLNVVLPTALVAGDLNGDGNLDLVTANKVGDSLGVLLGLGTGSFAPVVFYAAPGEPTNLFAADLDDDGRTDLLAPIRGSGVAVFSGSGTGTLLTPSGWYLDAHAYTLADFDRDGRTDLAFSNLDANSAGVCVGR